MRTPVPVSYKSNDAILCQLARDGKIRIDNLSDYRKDVRKITYSKSGIRSNDTKYIEPFTGETVKQSK